MTFRLWLAGIAAVLFGLAVGGGSRADDEMPVCAPGAAPRTLCRIATPPTAAAIENMLGNRTVGWAVEGGVFTVVTRRTAENVALCCAIQIPLARLGPDLWWSSVRVDGLERGILDVILLIDGRVETVGQWRGPSAPPAAAQVEASALRGDVRTLTVESRALGAGRRVFVYRPPGVRPSVRLPVIYMADGQGATPYAGVLEALIVSGQIQPYMIVAAFSPDPALGADGKLVDGRAREYLRGFPDGAADFAAYQRFFTDELLPFAERRLGASSRPCERIVAGTSNGAAWALAVGQTAPRDFPRIIALSTGWTRFAGEPTTPPPDVRWVLGSGTFEPAAQALNTRLKNSSAVGARVVSLERVSGHSPALWRDLFAEALITHDENLDCNSRLG